MKTLAARWGLIRNMVSQRMARLEHTGMIRGYRPCSEEPRSQLQKDEHGIAMLVLDYIR